MKKVLAMLLALVMIVSVVAACGKKDDAPATTDSKKAETTKADDSAPATEASKSETAGESASDESKPAESESESASAGKPAERSKDTLFVGTVEMDGFFINGFTNSSYDVAIKTLIGTYGKFYATYVSDQEGEFVLDKTTNAKDPEIIKNEDGSKTYRFFLNDNLVWNDGQKITAKDYVFGPLFAASPEWKIAGAATSAGDTMPGYEAYHKGESKTLPGIKYIDDLTFELTLDAKYVPYFYETANAAISPTPMHRYAPNLDIGEDGSSLVVKEGYEVTDKDKADYKARLDEQAKLIENVLKSALEKIEKDAKEKEDYTAEAQAADKEKAQKAHDDAIAEVDAQRAKVDSGEFDARDVLLQSNAYEVAQVYRYAPDVTCGPYSFVENKNQTVVLKLNDKFVGDFQGKKPSIPNIVQKKIPQDADADQLLAGEIDLAIGVSDDANILKLREAEEKGLVGYNSYPRAGFGMIRFLTDLGSTKHKEVRQAIGYLLDRNLFIQNYFGGYGTVTNGYYGLNEWTYKAKGDEFEDQARVYSLNIDEANKLLDNSPYKFEADGTTPWDAAKAKAAYEANAEKFDYWRYTAEKEKLVVNQTGANKEVLAIINQNLPNNGKLAGLQYNTVEVDFTTLLNALYNPDVENPKFTAFSLGTGFNPVFDPYYAFHSSQVGIDNLDRVNDPEADRITSELRLLDPKEKEKFLDYWLEFQLWFNDYLPELPLYSNDYYDAYAPHVEGMETLPYWPWYNDICNISLK